MTMRARSPFAGGLTLGLALAAFAHADNCAKQLPNLMDKSLLIVDAKITSVGPAPGFWTEVLPAIQTVQYEVLATYKGKVPDKQISVDHNVIKGSRLAEKHPPGLSHAYFAVGKEVVLFLRTPKQDIGGECAVEPRTASLDQQIQGLMHTAHQSNER